MGDLAHELADEVKRDRTMAVIGPFKDRYRSVRCPRIVAASLTSRTSSPTKGTSGGVGTVFTVACERARGRLWLCPWRLEVFCAHPLPFILARWRSHRRSSCHGSYRERSLRGFNWCARGACRRHARHAISARARCHGSDILCFRRLLARHAIFARLRENRPSAAETNADPRATDEAPPNSREGMFHELVLHKQAAALVGPTAHVIGAVSGGVDSTVAATLMHEARGEGF
jgi:hypothetical protein